MLQQNPLMLDMDQETVSYFEKMAPIANKLVVAKLEDASIEDFCQMGRDFFNAQAAQFDVTVPPQRATKLKKFFKKLKAIDADVFQQLKPLRTQMGLMSEGCIDFFLHLAEHILNRLKDSPNPTGSIFAVFFILLQALDFEVAQHMPKLQPGEPSDHDSIVARIVTDPEGMRQLQLWLLTFIFFYIFMRRQYHVAHFTERYGNSLSMQDVMDVRWADAHAIEVKIEQYLLEHAPDKPLVQPLSAALAPRQ